MELVPVTFTLERKSFLPILTVTGKCKNLPMVYNILISRAVQIIEFAQNKLKGKVTELLGQEHEIDIHEGMVAVRFYILFESDEDINQAITRIQKGLG